MRNAIKATTLLSTALLITLALTPRAAPGGQARYDPQTKSFRFTYAFASMSPEVSGSPIGARESPTDEQNATVRALLKEVSDNLELATGGRARISTLDRVDDAKDADIVISLSGRPNLHAWAMVGAIEGKPGHMAFFYQSLADKMRYNHQDVVLTAVHELSHYIFGLADEYDLSKFPGGCPLGNPGGPGCLMDNYNTNGTRHGWYNRFCRDDHNSNPAQSKSCQAIVDQFFASRGAPPAVEVANPELALRNVAANAIGEAKEELQGRTTRESTTAALSRESVKSRARRFMSEEVRRFKLRVQPEQVDRALQAFGDLATLVSVARPERFGAELVEVLVREARDLVAARRARSDSNGGQVAEDRRARTNETLVRQVRDRLLNLALTRLVPGTGTAPTTEAARALTPEERRFIDSLSRQASVESEETRRFDRVLEAARLQIELEKENAQNILDVGREVGVVGGAARRERIAEFDRRLQGLALPGRAFPPRERFGFRRTLILAPDPLNRRYDYVLTQSGVRDYTGLREKCIGQFARLVERARIEPAVMRGGDAVFHPFVRADAKQPIDRPGDRLSQLLDILNRVVAEVRDDAVENIIVVVPPDGFPDEIARGLENVRARLLGRVDLRLDVVLIGPASIPTQLRDLTIRSGGAIITATDIDEVGAIAQRLRNEQAAGSWVVLPHQGQIPGNPEAARRLSIEFNEDPLSSVREALKKLNDASVRPNYAELAAPVLDQTLGALNQLAPDTFARLNEVEDGAQLKKVQSDLRAVKRSLETIDPVVRKLRDRVADNVNLPVNAIVAEEVANLIESAFQARQLIEGVASNLVVMEKQLQETTAPGFPPGGAGVQRAQVNRDRDRRTDLDPIQQAVEVLQLIANRSVDRLAEFIQPRPIFARLNRVDTEDFLRRAEQPRENTVLDEFRHLNERLDKIESRLERGSDQTPAVAIADPLAVPPFAPREAAAETEVGGADRTLSPGQAPDPKEIRLARFYAEQAADYGVAQDASSARPDSVAASEFELILGTTRRLPGVPAPGQPFPREGSAEYARLPRLRLYTDAHAPVEAPSLRLDPNTSDDTILVYRLQFPRSHRGGYYNVELELVEPMGAAPINYTFSIASSRPNFELDATLVQSPADLDIDPPPADRGTVRAIQGQARIEVLVRGGAPVIDAEIRGFLHKIGTRSNALIDPSALSFSDDGRGGDRNAGDGIYTGLIPIDRLAETADYRVAIQATSTNSSRYIAPENPFKFDDERRELVRRVGARRISEPTRRRRDGQPLSESEQLSGEDPKPAEAVRFERATSLHFRVER